jgi:hypothetical protein
MKTASRADRQARSCTAYEPGAMIAIATQKRGWPRRCANTPGPGQSLNERNRHMKSSATRRQPARTPGPAGDDADSETIGELAAIRSPFDGRSRPRWWEPFYPLRQPKQAQVAAEVDL